VPSPKQLRVSVKLRSRRPPSDVITGLLTYIAILGLTGVWILGWMGLSVVVGSFFNLPLRTVTLVGAILGPLGFIVTIAIGFLETRQIAGDSTIHVAEQSGSQTELEDPFA